MSATVKIGHAVADENGKAKSGKPGDQNTKEVRVQNWFSEDSKWSYVIRAKDPKKAKKIAETMLDACMNDNIGYNQSKRTTLFDCAKKKNWNIADISAKCETDCSALVAVCVNAAGISVSKDMYTGNELKTLKNTGEFTVLTDEKYTNSESYLKTGDILLCNGHTAIVLSDGDAVTEFEPVIVTITANALNVRNGSSKDYPINTVVHKNEKYTIVEVAENGWGRLKSGAGWINLDYTNYAKLIAEKE